MEDRIINVIRENIGKEIDINRNTNLLYDLKIDSFDRLMIIAGLEEEFCININIDDFSQFEKVENIVDRLREELGDD